MSFLSVRLPGIRCVLGGRNLRCLFRERLVNKGLTSFSHRECGSRKSLTTFSSTHDYVICGAGSAGCVLANRLSADPNNNVLLLEAGPSDRWALTIQMPAALGLIVSNPKYNWCYDTVPQKNLNNRTIFCPRGRALGGSSSINGMVYIRGHAYDYDRWEREGAKGWSYADCLPYFRKAQNHELGADELYRGGDGPLHVTKAKLSNPLFHAFIKAGQEAGYPYTEDMNGYQQEGFGSFDMTVYRGKRWSTANAYLKPVQWERKKRLRIETQAFVTQILFEGNKAIGIEYQKNNQVRLARANKEVILSGGAINSPQLLMLSGIGDGNELKKHGIPVVCHLPGVGQNLQDHMQLIIQQASAKPITLWSKNPYTRMISDGLKWLITRKGLGTTCHLEAGSFIRSKEGVPHPNIEFHFMPVGMRDHGRILADQHAYQIHVGTLRSQSKGFVKLKSANPRDHPLIDFNYMSAEEDWEEMRAGVRLAREILQQKAFDEFRGEELTPGKNVQNDDEVDDFIRQSADTVYHHASSCKMGDSADKLAVVDNEARVFGVERLRVVDASIMPSIVSGNTNAPTIMIAEKAADHILGNKMLPKCFAPVYKTPEKGQR